jgi:serine/threonine protein kinase
MVVEYCPNGSLDSCLLKLSEEQKINIAKSVCSSVALLHSLFIVHSDLKPHNILLTEDYKPKLADFGVSSFLRSVTLSVTSSHKTTPNYAAPEQMDADSNLGLSVKTDVYGFGGLLLHLFGGVLPHSGLTQMQILKRVTIDKKLPSEVEQLQKLEKNWAQPLAKLVTWCLSSASDRRPSISQVEQALNDIFAGSFPFVSLRFITLRFGMEFLWI